MTPEQELALRALCDQYKVPFDPSEFTVIDGLLAGYVVGCIGDRLYVGCSPEGEISS